MESDRGGRCSSRCGPFSTKKRKKLSSLSKKIGQRGVGRGSLEYRFGQGGGLLNL